MTLGRVPANDGGRRRARARACSLLAATAVLLAVASWTNPGHAASAAAATPARSAANLATAVAGFSGVTLGISSLYSVSVVPGSWVPLALAVVNRGGSDLQGEVAVTSLVSPAGTSTGGCYSNGPSTFTCVSTGRFSAALPPSGSSRSSKPAVVTYKVPLALAAGTAKRLVVYLLAGPVAAGASDGVSAEVLGPSGRVLAKALARLPVANGAAEPAVLVVTDDPSAVSTLGRLSAPTGSPIQLQYLSPAELPVMAGALGTFSAVVIDQADTSVLSPAQGQALADYVDAGGALVVAGGLDWPAVTSGLPAGLLPGRAEGPVSSLALPGLSRLLGAQPLQAKVDVDDLGATAGAVATLSAGSTPLAIQADHGSGHVVVCAFDPTAPPLAGWHGTPSLLRRLFAPAFQPGFYASSLPYAEGGGVYPVAASTLPSPVVANLVAGFSPGTALMSPATAMGALSGYLDEVPTIPTPPSVPFLGLLLIGYVVLVGPICFLALVRLRRRELVWAVVPCLAVAAALAAGLIGPNVSHGPLLDEVRVAEIAPGGHLAQVTSLGVVHLPGGGSRQVELAGPASAAPALVGDLAVGADAGLTVGPGKQADATTLTVTGPNGSIGGWAASEAVRLPGTLRADVTRYEALYGSALAGSVTNDLGVRLSDAAVVLASGGASQALGTVEPGASARFNLALSPDNSPPAQAFGAIGPARPAGSPAALPAGSPAARQDELLPALDALAASYSAQLGGAPMFVALAGHPFFSVDAASAARSGGETQVIVVPLAAGERQRAPVSGLSGELVGAAGVTGENTYALTTGSLTLGTGGSFDYQFLLPGTEWGRLVLDLGSASGSAGGKAMVSVSVFDYRTSTWETLHLRTVAGQLDARAPGGRRYLGPGGALEVRVRAVRTSVEVYGDFPTLSATPEAP